MKKLMPLIAVLLFVVGITACPSSPEESGAVPAASASELSLAQQSADTFEVMATWQPVVFLNDTVRSYIRRVGTDQATFSDSSIINATGSEIKQIPSPPAGSTYNYFYCLQSRGVNEVGDTVATPDSMAACTSFQYTAPTSTPPPPDSLEVNPQQTLALDSLVLYPDSIQMEVGDTVQLTAAVYKDGYVVGCSGACDTVMITPFSWDRDMPVVAMGRYRLPKYFGQEPSLEAFARDNLELMAVRLQWFRQLKQYRGV